MKTMVAGDAALEIRDAEAANPEFKRAFKKNLEMVNRLCGLFDIMPGDSFSYFTYTLKRMFEYRGWMDNSRVRTEGFNPPAEYDALLKEKLEELNFPKE